LPEPRGALADLNAAAWSHHVTLNDGTFFRQLDDLDCILISMKYDELKKNKKASPTLHLLDMDLDINLMQATIADSQEVYILVKSE